MTLTTVLLTLKLLTVFVEPENPASKDDQALASCVAQAMTERPSSLTLAQAKDGGDATLTIGNHAGVRVHVLGRLVQKDGTVLVEVDHVTHGFNHKLCNQAEGLLDEMARKLDSKNRSTRD